jgi:class 3 adenylate cyclase
MRKLVTVLFADIVESTSRAEARDPEDTRALLAGYFAAMSDELRRQGGTVEKFIGDAIMAVFGVPAAHEDDPVRAVRAARAMLQRLDRWNAGRDQSSRIQIRIGINTGEVLAAGEAGPDLLVTGDAVNVAARIEQAAPTGGILVGDRTARGLRGGFELQELEPLGAKGKSEPVAVWLVEAARAEGPATGIPGLSAPIVGRDEELRLLGTTFAAIRREGKPHLITISGDAGVGKTRLVREFVTILGSEIRVVVGRCLPYGEGVSLWPLGEILRSEAVLLDTDAPGVALEKIGRLVHEAIPPELAPDPDWTSAALASTIGLEPEHGALAAAAPRELRQELTRAWRALLAGIARRAPVVVVIEDIHWADEQMLELIDDLAEHVEGPVMFLCSARPDLLRARPTWGGGRRNYSTVPLDPLTEQETRQLIEALLETAELPAELQQRLLERSEGSPFFLEEILRNLIDRGHLVEVEGRWGAVDDLAEVEVPDTVQGVILARLDLLTALERRVVQGAAVIGRTFWRGALASLTGNEGLDVVLDTLQRRELVHERLTSTMAGEIEYSFKHVLIRDVAYGSLPRHERAKAHANTAGWIEERSGDRAEENAELLAHHYQVAGFFLDDDQLREHARRYSLVAARSALRRFSLHQAETFGWLAVDLSRPGGERVEALEALGDLFALTSRGDGAWKAYGDAIAELEHNPPLNLYGLGRLAAAAVTAFARRYPTFLEPPTPEQVRALIETGLDAVGKGDSPERVQLLAARSDVKLKIRASDARENEEARRAGEEAIAIAERLDDADLISLAIDATNTNNQQEERYGEVYRNNLRRLELVPRLTNVAEVGDAHVVAAWSSGLIGRYVESIEHATRCIEVARGVDSGQYLHGLIWRVFSTFRAGRWELTLADQAEIERLEREEGLEERMPLAMIAHAVALLCHQLRGEERETDAYLAAAEDFLAGSADRHADACRSFVARTLLHRGEREASRAMVTAIRRRFAFPFEALCDLLAEEEDWEEASQLLPEVRGTADRGEHVALHRFADRLEGCMAAGHEEYDEATTLLRRSAEGFSQLGAPWEAALSRLRFGELLLAVGQDEAAKREVTAALSVFHQLGSVHECERSRGLLERVHA